MYLVKMGEKSEKKIRKKIQKNKKENLEFLFRYFQMDATIVKKESKQIWDLFMLHNTKYETIYRSRYISSTLIKLLKYTIPKRYQISFAWGQILKNPLHWYRCQKFILVKSSKMNLLSLQDLFICMCVSTMCPVYFLKLFLKECDVKQCVCVCTCACV